MAELTERQEQCLRMTATMTDKEIARELGISPHTVNMHIRKAMEKLDTTSRGGALRAIAGNSLHELSVIEPTTKSPPSDGVVEPEREAHSSFREDPKSWFYLPALLPRPPRSKLMRALLILGLAFFILAVAASLLGLFGMVTEHLDRWAVDPKKS